jgi:enediyne biosynthesis protein E4
MKASSSSAALGALILAASAACDREPARPPEGSPGGPSGAAPSATGRVGLHFTDVTAASGIDFTTTSGRAPSTQLLEVKGAGLALLDYDRDGDLDLFVPNGALLDAIDRGPGARLYRNLGGLRFEDVTREARIEFTGWGFGVAVGDVDGDGFDDLFVACYGPDALLKNRGDGTFEDATARAGLGDPRWATGCAFGDLDGDLDLDLYVVRYVEFDPERPPAPQKFRGIDVFGGPIGLVGEPDLLYENDGHGVFRDVSESSGILAVPPAYGLGVAILDFDEDGLQDVFVGNDSQPKNLFKNLGRMRFEDVALATGIAFNGDGAAQATMGIAIGDVNGDGRADVFTTNFANDTNTLHATVAGGFVFDDRTRQFHLGMVSRPFLGWATMLYDFDHDADEDLIVFNGHVYPQATLETMDSSYRQTPLLFERAGAAFERVTPERAGDWLAAPRCDRTAAFGDLDLDGDVDVVVGGLGEKLRVLRNDTRGGHWLSVRLEDRRAQSKNRSGLGARLRLSSGAGSQVRWIFGGGSYQAASAQAAHFGLGAETRAKLEVRWPDGAVQTVEDLAVDRALVLEHP